MDGAVGAAADGTARSEVELHTEGLSWLLGGLVTQAVGVAVSLGLPDLLVSAPRTVEDLAGHTGADRTALARVLRLLADVGFVAEDDAGRHRPTPLGRTLATGGSLHDAALFYAGDPMWTTCGALGHSVAGGRSAFEARHGRSLYDHLEQDARLRGIFRTMMGTQSVLHTDALLAHYDFARFDTVVDVGGGNGATLAAVLRAHPGVRGVLLDRPAVVQDVSPLERAGVRDRCEVVAGDMLCAVPTGARCYLIKRVLCDMDDDDAVTVLRACASAVAPGGRVLIVDQDLGADGGRVNRLLDVLFLAVFGGGRLRTVSEYRELLGRAGLSLIDVRTTGSPNVVLEAVPDP